MIGAQSPTMRQIIEGALNYARQGKPAFYKLNDEDVQRVCEECLFDMEGTSFATNDDMIDMIEAVMRDHLQPYVVYP